MDSLDSLWDNLGGPADLSATAAQSKRPASEDTTPTQQPMRAGLKPAQQKAPTQDQKKVRRAMNKNASSTPTKESTAMTESQPTEADLMTRLAMATTLAEQTTIAAQIEDLRAARRESMAVEGAFDWGALSGGDAGGFAGLPVSEQGFAGMPVTASVRLGHTDATDWLADAVPSHTDDAVMTAQMRATASRWYEEVYAPVKQDPAEFAVQARNAAARSAVQYGDQARSAASVFLAQAQHLASREGIDLSTSAAWGTDPYDQPNSKTVPTYVSDGRSKTDVGVSPSKAQDTFDELPSGRTNTTDPKSTDNRGEAPSLAEGSTPEGDSAVDVENPDFGQTGQDKSGWDTGWADRMKTQGAGLVHAPSSEIVWDGDSEHTACEPDKKGKTANNPDDVTCPACREALWLDGDPHQGSKTAGEYKGGSPKSGDTAKCHKDGGNIQFFDGQWMHLNDGTGSSHNDVYPATPREQAEKDKKSSSLRTTADLVDDVMSYEGGEMDEDQTVAFFQRLIDDGSVWHLQGSYGRMAQNLIDAGLCHAPAPAGPTTASLSPDAPFLDKIAAAFATDSRAIQTLAESSAPSTSTDGSGSAQTATEAPSLDEGSTPEGDHAESAVQEPGQGASDQSSPTDSDRPGGGVNWGGSGGSGGAAQSQDGAYTATLSDNGRVFVSTLARMATLDEEIAGITGHQVAAFLLAEPGLPEHVAEVLKAGGNPFGREAIGPTNFCKICNAGLVGGPVMGWHHNGPDGDELDAEHKPEPGGKGYSPNAKSSAAEAAMFSPGLTDEERKQVSSPVTPPSFGEDKPEEQHSQPGAFSTDEAPAPVRSSGRPDYVAPTKHHLFSRGGLQTEAIVGTTCQKCGFKPKNPSSALYYSAMSGETQCVDGAACKQRREKSSKSSALQTEAGEGARIPYKCPNCGKTWVKKTLYGGEHCPKCNTKGEVNFKSKSSALQSFASAVQANIDSIDKVAWGSDEIDPKHYQHEYDSFKRSPDWELNQVQKALNMMPFLNGPHDKARLKAVQDIKAERRKKRSASLQVEAVAWGRRHYEDLAETLATLPDGEREKAAEHFGRALSGTNPNYRRQQFEDAAKTPGYRVRGGTGTAKYSRGHYQTIADAIRSYPGDKDALRHAMSEHFQRSNAQFKPSLFEKASTGSRTAAGDGPTNTWKCERCGGPVERWRGESDVTCPKCGAEYNAAGQRLRDDWRGNPSNYDDEIGDMEGYEMQHANDY